MYVSLRNQTSSSVEQLGKRISRSRPQLHKGHEDGPLISGTCLKLLSLLKSFAASLETFGHPSAEVPLLCYQLLVFRSAYLPASVSPPPPPVLPPFPSDSIKEYQVSFFIGGFYLFMAKLMFMCFDFMKCIMVLISNMFVA